MKVKNTNAFMWLSTLALAIVLGIQINWIFKTARVKEELFNEKANMVLSRTAEALCEDKETCANIGQCCMMDSPEDCTMKLGRSEARKIDSLLRYFMNVYHFKLDYTFEVVEQEGLWYKTQKPDEAQNVYKQKLEEVASRNGLELKLVFPQKKEFILQEMGGMFITSVVLMLVVLAMFRRTLLLLKKEKSLAEFTTEFLNNMTHEFKTPLTNISMAGKMVNREAGMGNTEKVKHYTDIILAENEKLRQQAEQVLNITALEKGEVPMHKAEVNVQPLIENAVKSMSVQAEYKGGSITGSFEAENTVVWADRVHLSNALSNLIDNALKYGGEQPQVTVHTKNTGNQFEVTVSDNGPGIDEAYHSKIFERYFRVPTGNIHDVKGFGLGLAYVKKVIEMHEGRVELVSGKGKGAKFVIKLPLYNAR